MALANLYGWSKETEQGAAAACGTACGAGDVPKEEKPAACGSACGAGDAPKEEKTAAACGTGCGAGDAQ